MHEAYSISNCRNIFTNFQTLDCFKKFSAPVIFFSWHSGIVDVPPLNCLNAFDNVIEHE